MGLRAAVIAIGAMIEPILARPAPRTDAEERDYFLKRAEDHRQLAAGRADPGSRALHLRFEQLYRARAQSDSDGIFRSEAPAKIPGTSDLDVG